MSNKKTIKIYVYDKDYCDEEFFVIEINGFGYDVVTEMIEQLYLAVGDWLEKYRGKTVVFEPKYFKGQIGSYEPPNVEIEPCWEFDEIEVDDCEVMK